MLKRLLKIEDYPAKWLRVYLKMGSEAVLMWTPEAMAPESYLMLMEKGHR